MSLTNEEVAFALAKQFGVPIAEPEAKAAPRLQYSTLRTLQPGQDYYEGVLYYTVPAFLHTTKKKGKGKDAPEVPVIETYTQCVTSEKEVFAFDEVSLYDRGFSFPDTFQKPPKDHWGGDIIQEIAQGNIAAPEPQDLYFRVRKVYEQYMEYADEAYYDLMTAWLMGTYMFKVFKSYPYLHFNGTRDSGKSQNLRILKILGFNTHWSAEMTAADMYRHIAGNPGVICIDESESWKGERAEALKAILRSGYADGLEVSRQRQQPDGAWVQERFPVYCPKALASINPLDDTTQSRTLVVRMRPAIRIIKEFSVEDPSKWVALVNDLHLFGLANAKAVHARYAEWAVLHHTLAPSLTNRAWELAAPLVVLTDYIWGREEANDRIQWLTAYFEETRKASDSTDIIRLLAQTLPEYIRNNVAHEEWYYPVRSILDNMVVYMDADSSERITTRSMVRWLTPLGFTKTTNVRGGKMVQILEADLRKVLQERRIDPPIEHLPWLEGSVDYQTTARIVQPEVQEGFTWNEG